MLSCTLINKSHVQSIPDAAILESSYCHNLPQDTTYLAVMFLLDVKINKKFITQTFKGLNLKM